MNELIKKEKDRLLKDLPRLLERLKEAEDDYRVDGDVQFMRHYINRSFERIHRANGWDGCKCYEKTH